MELFTDFMAMIGVYTSILLVGDFIVTLYKKIAKWGKHHVG